MDTKNIVAADLSLNAIIVLYSLFFAPDSFKEQKIYLKKIKIEKFIT